MDPATAGGPIKVTKMQSAHFSPLLFGKRAAYKFLQNVQIPQPH